MSNDSIPDCLVHKDTRNIQVRLDYMLLYRNEAKAKVIRTMETWTDTKRAEWYKLQSENKEQGSELLKEPPEEALWVTMSYEEFSIYAYGTIKRDDIKVKVDELVNCKHLDRRPHPTIPYGPPQYLLNLKLLQKALDEQEMPSLFEDIGKIAPPRKKHTPREKYPQGGGINHRGDPGLIPPGTGDFSYPSNNTTENTNNTSKNRGMFVGTSADDANAPTNNMIDFKKATDGRMKAVKGASNAISHSIDGDSADTNIGRPLLDTRLPAGHQKRVEEAQPQVVSSHSQGLSESDDVAELPTEKMRITKPEPVVPSQQTTPSLLPVAPAAVVSPPASDGPQGADVPPMAMTARQIAKQLEQRQEEILALYAQKIGRKPSRSKANLDGALKLAQEETTDEDIGTTIDAILADTFLAKNLSLTFVHSKLDALARKPTPTHLNGKAPTRDANVGVSGLQKFQPRKAIAG